VHSDSCHLLSRCFDIRELKVCLPFNSLIVSLANTLIIFITIFFPLPSYNISHKIMPYRKETSLEVGCNYRLFALCVLFVELDFALIFSFLANSKAPAVPV